MEAFVAQMLDKFEQGKISRRKLIETLAVAATTIYGAGKAPTTVEAAAPNGRGSLKTLLVNHISYGCPDYRPARDFYRDVMGMEPTQAEQTANATSATLAFGPKGAIPLNSPYGTPVTFLIVRNGRGTQEPQTGNRGGRGGSGAPVPPAPKVETVINHIAYTIADWDQKRVFEELKKRGLRGRNISEPREDTVNSYHVMDPHGYDVQISGVKMSAFGSGG
jgi:catechol 2,3-dioxygenase-like lactoylglutathione lyase family enzyme